MDKNNQTEPLKVISSTELMEKHFPTIKPVITRILPTGTFIFAGASKIGKSWMILWFANQVALGKPVWDFETTQSEVLYLALEDTERRLQDRLSEIADEVGTFHLAIESAFIGAGFEEQLTEFISTHKKVKLVIIDTLQKIRKSGKDTGTYADDYEVISAVKQIADKLDITIVILHHTRKEGAKDTINTISGTTGIVGSADGAFVLTKDERNESKATLFVTGRDVENITLEVSFDCDTCMWNLIKHSDEDVTTAQNPLLIAIYEFMAERETFQGTATALVEVLEVADIKPNTLTRVLRSNEDLLQAKFKISFHKKRIGTEKHIILIKEKEKKSEDIEIKNGTKHLNLFHVPTDMYDKTDI